MSPRVLWVVVDSLGLHHLTPEVMPRLYALGAEGGRADNGGIGELPALTYPNHATFVTGASPLAHGVMANDVFRAGAWVGAEEVGPAVPTVFEAASGAGLQSVAVFGDQNLVGVCGARSAWRHWPPDGVHDAATPKGVTGYATDAAVVRAVQDIEPQDSALTFVQLDEMDADSHLHGPQSENARERARAVDRCLVEMLALYEPVWSDTLVVVLSDHCQEEVAVGASVAFDVAMAGLLGTDPPLNPLQGDARGRWRTDGTAGWVASDAGLSAADVEAIEGIAHVRGLEDGSLAAWGAEGSLLGFDWGQRGDHGSGRTAAQVAVVGGGHPLAARLGRWIGTTAPRGRDWCGWVLAALGLTEGHD
ncbi:MAG: hypothetical protein GY812_11545 [Actinomycetia bacterium]|nr:hypothetical protein [Actinomycetes bacterium]